MQFSKSCATPDILSFHPGKSSFIFTLMVPSLGRGPTSATTAQSPTLASIHGTKLKQAVAPPQVERTSPMTDYKALCARMADELDHYRQLLMDDRRETHALATEARAALAQPEPEGPSDEELTQFLFENFRGPIEFLCDAEEEAHLMIRSHVKFARAVLARWGRPQGT
jgi:hypothetical protein